MINFLRRIRQNLLNENKLGTYLIYAIGEVLLVVLGILIAIQIDNWNEDRNQRKLEKVMLADIRDNLIASRDNLQSNISYNKKTLYHYEVILDHIKKGLPYTASLDTAFSYLGYWSDPNITYTAYETIKSLGLDIIQNNALKNSITKIYEQDFPFLAEELQAEWELYHSVVIPFITRHIQYIEPNVARPNDFDAIKGSSEFQNLMGLKLIIRGFSIQYAETTREKVDSLIIMIDRELGY